MNDWNVRNVSGVSGMTGMSGKTGKTGKTGNVWKDWSDWNVWNVLGRSCKTHGCISRRSPCLLCVEFLFWNEGLFLPSVCSSNTRRALCLLHVELDSGWRILWMHVYTCMELVCGCSMVDGYPCRIGAEESCRTSSCRIAVLEVSVKTVVPLLRMEHF